MTPVEKKTWTKTLVAIPILPSEDGRMSLARMTHKAIVMSRMAPWETRRKMVNVLTPPRFGLGLKKDKMGLCGGWGGGADRLPLVLAIAGGAC